MRKANCTLWLVFLALVAIGCGGGHPEGPDPMAAMKKNKVVRIATDAVNLPFEFGSGTGVQGLDVDIGTEIGKDLGYDVKWIKTNFEKLLDLLRNGEVEMVISAISITPERQKDFGFSEPYFDSGNTIARRRDKPEIKDMASLAGKKVGVQSSATGQLFVESQKTVTGITVHKFPTLDDALGALNRTEVDAVVGDEPILTYSIFKSFPNLMTTGAKLTEERYGVVMRKGDKQLVAKVNGTLARLRKSGTLEELRKKWFQNVMGETTEVRNKLEEQERLKAAPKSLTVSITKTGGAFRMDRLDGHQISVSGAGGSFTSSAINTTGNRGSCKFGSPLPPGDYRLSMPVLHLNGVAVTIPKSASRSLTLEMSIGNQVSMAIR